MDGVAIAQNIMSTSLHQEIHRITDTEEHAREFLFQRGIPKATMSCPGCSSPMTLVACSSSKSSDLLIWRCPPCKRFKNIRSDSVLSGQKLSLSLFLLLVFHLSIKSLPSVAISCRLITYWPARSIFISKKFETRIARQGNLSTNRGLGEYHQRLEDHPPH